MLELVMKMSLLQINSGTIRQQHTKKSASWRKAFNCSTETEVVFILFRFWPQKATHQTPLGPDSLIRSSIHMEKCTSKAYPAFNKQAEINGIW